MFKICECCTDKPSETTMNNNGDIIYLCKKCYKKIKYGAS